MITGSQLRAARALLDWTQDDLAERSGVTAQTIRLFEAGNRRPYRQTVDQLKSALEEAGIEFLVSDVAVGVMLASQ
jgi:transcriptional regulator with XRE-family HTH domain